VPRFNELLAPRFEVARFFVMVTLEEGAELSREVIHCTGCEGFGRVQLLLDQHVEVLICNGIKSFYRDLLHSYGIRVIPDAAGTVDAVLADFLTGRLQPGEEEFRAAAAGPTIPLEDLVCWSKELFTAHGFTVFPATDRAPFPVDLIAEIRCPVCGKPIRVAICCGAHTYRCDQELSQLHQVANADFDAYVYIHTATEPALRYCSDYGFELLDPNAQFASSDRPEPNRIPILQNPIPGHEDAFASGPQERAD